MAWKIVAVLDTGPTVRVWAKDDAGTVWQQEMTLKELYRVVHDLKVPTKEHLIGRPCRMLDKVLEVW